MDPQSSHKGMKKKYDASMCLYCESVCRQHPCGPGVQVLMSTDVSNYCPPEEGLSVEESEERRGIDLGV